MASQREASNTAVQALRVDTGKVTPSPKSPPEHPATLTLKHLSSIYQHLQACFNGVNACKYTFERFEYAYRQESHKLKDLRKQYDTLAGDNQYYQELFPQYKDTLKGMQISIQSSEVRNREYESRIKDLERENQEAKEELSVALARIGDLEGKVVSSVQQAPTISKRQRPADLNGLDAPLEPEKKRGRPRKHPKLMNEANAEVKTEA